MSNYVRFPWRMNPKQEKKSDMAMMPSPGQIIPGVGYQYYTYDNVVPAQPKPAFDPKMETIIEPIVGWRKWKAGLWDDTIASINGVVWPVKEPLKAKCRVDGQYSLRVWGTTTGVCKGVHCSCGVYAFRTEPQVLAEFPNGPSPRDPASVNPEPEMFNIVGEVSLWGRIIECDKGYRAQYAYPKSFRNNGPIAAKLAEVYGVKLI